MSKKQTTSAGSDMPQYIDPMLCTLVAEPPPNQDYLFEMKWDGYRIIASVKDGQVRMNSRSGLDYTKKYPLIANSLRALGHDVIIDGEVVVFNEEGKADFDALQLYNEHTTPIKYCVFDLLWIDGKNIMDLPLIRRKALLDALIENKREYFVFSESFDDGAKLYQQALDENLEGIVAKQSDSVYSPGERGNAWLKVPTRKRQEFVIGGWAESDKSRSFRSLLFGAYENGEFVWIGRSGGGYKNHEMPGILAKLQAIETDKSPFANKVLDTKGAKIHYVKPELVANFEFATWTKSGRIRKPATFLGFRNDKNAKDVVREVPKQSATKKSTEQVTNQIQEFYDQFRPYKKEKLESAAIVSYASNWKRILEEKTVTEGAIQIEGHDVELKNIERELWKGINKAELIKYYNSVSKYILPYLKDRPLSLDIRNVNAAAPGFYIKDMEGMQPDYVDIFRDKRRVPKRGKRNVIDYAICNNTAALLYFVNLGCIDFNPWSATIQHPSELDYISIDLDPTDDDFQKVISTALAVKEVLDANKLKAVVKTSGKTGLHIYIPCQGFENAIAKQLGKIIYNQVHELVPAITTDIVSKDKRSDSVYVDYTLNDYADTLASAYSVRPYHIPTVSTPLDWKEVNTDLDPSAFTMETVLDRFERKGDLFKDLFDQKIIKSNTALLKKWL